MQEYYWFALKSIPMVGNVAFRRLLDHFTTPEQALRASLAELTAIKGIAPALAASITAHDYKRFAESECEKLAQSGARLVTCKDEEYPGALLEIPDPPPFLYVKGDLKGINPAIAIVGSRKASSYGLAATGRLAEELARQGIVIVSGMARGVDTAAHRCALKAGGKSIGVLGCGIDVIYPPENRPLYAEMPQHGAIVSEFPFGTTPLAENFPRRNRIISGISQGVLVVEAAEKSGSLITAQFALEQGREVFAIPGNITSGASRGTNRLIKQGAKLVECVEDILEEFPFHKKKALATPATPSPNLAPQEAAIYATLAESPQHIDEIITKSALTVGEVSVILLRLELKGVVQQLPGKYFAVA